MHTSTDYKAQPGPGDQQTWGPVTSPRDPRAEDPDAREITSEIHGMPCVVHYEAWGGSVELMGITACGYELGIDAFSGALLTALKRECEAAEDRLIGAAREAALDARMGLEFA